MARGSTFFLVAVLILLLGGFLALIYIDRSTPSRAGEEGAKTEPAAPADLKEHRDSFLAGFAALERQDPAAAIDHFTSFTLQPREVEQYRLYYLARAYQLKGDSASSREALSELWRAGAGLVHNSEVAGVLGQAYARAGAWSAAAGVYETLAARAGDPAIRGAARMQLAIHRFRAGDPAAMLFAARNTLIDSPEGEQAGHSADIVRSLSGLEPDAPVVFAREEKIRRAENLIRDRNPAAAITELRSLDAAALPAPFQQRVILARGLAYHHLRQYEQSDRTLEPLFAGFYKYAEPALLASAKNNRIVAASIDPTVIKTVSEKKKTGTRRVKVKGKFVRRPVYRTVKRNVKLVDLNRKKRKEDYERRHIERLKDLLQIPAATVGRKEALSRLIEIALAKKQTAYLRELAPQLAKIEPSSEPALQYFWDSAWAAYQRGDVPAARDLLGFISQTYQNPNVRRQATYWLARIHERAGEKEQANALLQQLANAPYEDLYAVHAKRRGLKAQGTYSDPFAASTPDWTQIAEKEMPPELRLAYELTALGIYRDARIEVQKNASDANRKYADAILGDLYASEGATILAHRYMRRAFPKLATVEQNEVPAHFLRGYYPLKFEKEIREASADRELDPYLVMALVHQESAFNPEIRSRVGAIGLMQLMPATGREIGNRLYAAFTEARLKNPEVNLELGTYYLRSLLNETGGVVEFALAAYNAGPGNVRKWRRASPRRPVDEFVESIPYAETRGYVKRITLLRSSYERLHQSLSRPPDAGPAGQSAPGGGGSPRLSVQ